MVKSAVTFVELVSQTAIGIDSVRNPKIP